MDDIVSIQTPASDWVKRASCRDHPSATWFPQDAAEAKEAREICRQCSVRAECLDYALATRIDVGIWGGTSPGERVRIAARLRMQRNAPKAS